MAELWWRETWKEAIYESDLKPLERIVAFVYADHARERRSAWVTLDRLVETTGMSRTQAQSWRSRLVKSGFLVELSKATHHRATLYGLVIPDGQGAGESAPSGCRDIGTHEEDRVPEIEGQGAGNEGSGCRDIGTNQSLINHSSISLSPEQELVTELLGLDRGDERLQLVEGLLEYHEVRSPKPWLRKCHANGELLDVLDSIQADLDADPEFEDEGYMDHPGYVEGWGLPERVKIEDYYLSRILGLGYDEEQARAYLAKAVEIYPTGTERKCWHEAYMTALNDTRCEECGCNPGNHSPICSQAPEQQDRAAS